MGLRWREERMAAARPAKAASPGLAGARKKRDVNRWVTAAALAAVATIVMLGGLHWVRQICAEAGEARCAPPSSSSPAPTASATWRSRSPRRRRPQARHALARRRRAARRPRPRGAARRLLLRRLPALRRHGRALADHARGAGLRRRAAATCSACATASRSCARRGCCPARCCATPRCASCPWTATCAWSAPTRPSPARFQRGQVFRATMAHGDGNYFADDATLDRLEGEGLVALRYATPAGEATPRPPTATAAPAASPASSRPTCACSA